MSVSNRFYVCNARRTPLRVDGRSEVIPHGATVGHVDRLSSSDRKERHVTEVGHASQIAFCVVPHVLVEERTVHVWPELKIVRRGRISFVPVRELEAWLDRNAATA
jgi:hypothetical protein